MDPIENAFLQALSKKFEDLDGDKKLTDINMTRELADYIAAEDWANGRTVTGFNEGRNKYKKGSFESSILSFKECLKANPKDNLSQTYIDRCTQLIKENPENWDGIWVMKSK